MENEPNESMVPTITFIAVTLTRLAYLSDCEFLIRYLEIFDTYGWKKIKYNNNNRCDRTINRSKFVPSYLTQIKPINNSVLVNIKYTNVRDIFNSVNNVRDFLPYIKYINYVNNEAELSKYITDEKSTPDEVDNIVNEEIILPDQDVVLPDQDVVLPDQDVVLPDQDVVLPDQDVVLPDQDAVLHEENILNKIIPNSRLRNEIRAQGNERIKYVSLSWSEYSTIYIIADKMMNSIWINFKGTGTAESSFSYLHHTSFRPTIITDTDEGFLIRIYNLINENIHMIIESIRYLVHFLNPNNDNPNNKIKIFTTGHSLGGAMATIFSFLWAQLNDAIENLREERKYNILNYPENLLAKITKEIVCITVGAPRVLNLNVVEKFQQYMSCGYILFKRIINEDDPIPKLPPSLLGYYHPDYNLREEYMPLISCENDTLICMDRLCKVKAYDIKCKLMNHENADADDDYTEDEIFDRYFTAKCVGKLCRKVNMLAHTNYYYISYIMNLTLPLIGSLIAYGDIERDQSEDQTSCILKKKQVGAVNLFLE
jgi:hypothetical protein